MQVITQDIFLTAIEVEKLYHKLGQAKDLALYRNSHHVHVRDHYAIKTLLESGVRVFELVALKVGDFRRNALIVQRGKFGKKREVILTADAQALLREWLRMKRTVLGEPTADDDYLFLSQWQRPYSTMGIRKRVKFWFGECGFNPKFSCHTCRHSYVSHGLASGVDISRMRHNVGHASLNTTSIYDHAVNNDLGALQIYQRKSFVNSGKRNFQGKPGRREGA